MKERYSVREAAAIAEVSPETIRTALEKKALRPSHKHKTGKAVRYGFSVRDVLLMKLFTEFPFPLGKDDKDALRAVLLRRAKTANRWRVAGPDLVFASGQVEVIVQCKHIRRRLAHNIAAFHWGKRRIVMSPEILSGEPVFRELVSPWSTLPDCSGRRLMSGRSQRIFHSSVRVIWRMQNCMLASAPSPAARNGACRFAGNARSHSGAAAPR